MWTRGSLLEGGRVTRATVFASGWLALLPRASARDDVPVGNVVAGATSRPPPIIHLDRRRARRIRVHSWTRVDHYTPRRSCYNRREHGRRLCIVAKPLPLDKRDMSATTAPIIVESSRVEPASGRASKQPVAYPLAPPRSRVIIPRRQPPDVLSRVRARD